LRDSNDEFKEKVKAIENEKIELENKLQNITSEKETVKITKMNEKIYN